MAVREAPRALRFKMSFPEKVLGDPIMHQLSQKYAVVPNILRGRITEKTARLDVEIVGTEGNIDRALKYLAELGVSIQKLDG